MIDEISYDKVEELNRERIGVEIKNVYVRNLLKNDIVEIEGLEEIYKDEIEKKCKLIRRNNNYNNNNYKKNYKH